MCFITQLNATDVASFVRACNWHADCKNVHQSCCPWIECSFLYHKPSPKAFQRICALMSIVLTPPILLPDYWLICPTCLSSLPSSFAPFIFSLCLQSCASSSSFPHLLHYWVLASFVHLSTLTPPYPASSPPRSSETDTRTAAAPIGLHNQRISTQTVRNRLREAHLLARRTHQGLDLTAVRRRNPLE